MTKILHKRGSGEPDAGSLDVGEIALDTSTGTAYTKLPSGTVVEIGGGDGGNIDPGNQDGEILTWDVSAAKWVDNDTMIVKGGRVGIGTSGPQQLLHLSGSGASARIANTGVSNSGLIISYQDNNSHGLHLTYTPDNATAYIDNTFPVASGTVYGDIYFRQNVAGTMTTRMMIAADGGNVGIGGEPSRSTKEIEAEAVATLANWKSQLDDRLKAEPKADKKAVTLEITGHDKMPTKAELIKQLTERNIGGGDAKLQVAGDGYFSGTVNSESITLYDAAASATMMKVTAAKYVGSPPYNDNIFEAYNSSGIAFTTGGAERLSIDSTGYVVSNNLRARYWMQVGNADASDASNYQYIGYGSWNTGEEGWQVGKNVNENNSLGNAGDFFFYSYKTSQSVLHLTSSGNAHFKGTIYGTVADVPAHVKAITQTQIANWDAGTGSGGGGGATVDPRISDTQINNWDAAYSWGNHAGLYASSGHTHSEYLPKAGDWACSGNITATGNITAYAASDERLKDDIAPMPLGLIDGIAPATFKWKDSGKSSGGVIAQQLQACGLGDWVNEAPNGDLGVDYNALIGVLLAEVQDLKARVKELEG